MDILTVILSAFAGAVPALALAGWALFEAKAAKSEAVWDDWVVARVKDVARGVLGETSSATKPE